MSARRGLSLLRVARRYCYNGVVGTKETTQITRRREGTRTLLYTESLLSDVLDAMARQLAGSLRAGEEIVLLGVLRRGVPLSAMLEERLQSLGVRPARRLQLEVKRYADDLRLLHPETLLRDDAEERNTDLAQASVVVVDDVLYRGHSLVRVVQHLAARGVGRIRSAVLVDRCCSVLPIQADVTGLRLQVAPGAIVEVHVPPYEADFSIELVSPDI